MIDPSPVHPRAAHVDGTNPQRQYSHVFHRDRPGHCLATFHDPDTHRADAEAYIAAVVALHAAKAFGQ